MHEKLVIGKKVAVIILCHEFWRLIYHIYFKLFVYMILGSKIHQRYFETWDVNDWFMWNIGEYCPEVDIREWSWSGHCISHGVLFELVKFWQLKIHFCSFSLVELSSSLYIKFSLPGLQLTGLQILEIRLCFSMMMWWNWILELMLMVVTFSYMLFYCLYHW